jgi:hypothetical protein
MKKTIFTWDEKKNILLLRHLGKHVPEQDVGIRYVGGFSFVIPDSL